MGAEERLRHQHRDKRDQHAQRARGGMRVARGGGLAAHDEDAPGMVHRQIHGVQQPEHHELKAGAVPHPRQRHREQRGQRNAAGKAAQRLQPGRAHRQVAVRAPLVHRHRHRVIQIRGDVARQRHVPARPEFDDVACLVGRVEIQREADAEHLRQAQRHVRIAREIKVKLERIAKAGAPRSKELQVARRCEPRVGVRRDAIGQQHLLGQADHEQDRAHRQVLGLEAVILRLRELRHHFLVMQDRAGDQVRKERHEQHVAQQAALFHDARLAVQQITDLCEREERNAQRQDDVVHGCRRHAQVIQEVQQRHEILVVKQQRQIGAHAQPHDQALQPGACDVVQDQLADQVVEGDGAGQQHDELRIPPAIEHQRGQAQPQRRQPHVQRSQRVVHRQRHGQEDEQEQVGVE